jgi:hypothetical protein
MKRTSAQPDQEILSLLEALKSVTVDYPPDLLAMRRAAVIEKSGLLENHGVQDSSPLDEAAMIEMLQELQHVRAKYPPLLLARQRAAFLDQIEKHRKFGWIETLLSPILSWFTHKAKVLAASMTGDDLRRSLVVVSLLVAAFAGIMVYGGDRQPTAFSGIHLTERDISQPIGAVPAAAAEITEKACTPDSPSAPACLTHGFAESPDQTAWVSNSTDSWIAVDMGQTVSINKVELERNYSDGSKGDFTISVAQSEGQYKKVYDSKSDNFAQPVVGTAMIQVSFEPVLARYVKVTVADRGTVINEVKAFSVIVPPTPRPRTEGNNAPSLPTAKPSNTPLPTKTPLPTRTPIPTDPPPTSTPLPTDTRWPTDTPAPTSTPLPTNTPMPTDTRWPTNTPMPTDTRWPTDTPEPTSTPLLPTDPPMPTDTRWPTDTPEPTSMPLPEDTPLPTQPTMLTEYIYP